MRRYVPTKVKPDGEIVLGSKFYADWDDFDIYPQTPTGVVKSLTKAGRNVIGEALTRLDAIPKVDGEHMKVPWPITKRPRTDRWAESVIETVPIIELFATQDLLTVERVRFYVKNPGAMEEGRRAFANVYDRTGKLAIVDGHHRLAALWLLGADDALVWMLRDEAE